MILVFSAIFLLWCYAVIGAFVYEAWKALAAR